MTTDRRPAPAAATAPAPAPVAVLGLGLMGTALADAFLAAGHRTTVWNRTAARAEGPAARGAHRAATPAEAAAAAPLVVLCLGDHHAVGEVLDAAGDALAGRVLVDVTSGTSADAAAVAEAAARYGARSLDGALLATPDAIGAAGTVVLYSGPEAAFRAHEATLTALGGCPTYLGDGPGLASLHDVALLAVLWSGLNGFLHAAALLRTAGIGATDFAPTAELLFDGIGAFLARYARQVDEGDYPAEDSALRTHLAAARHLLAESERRGLNPALPRQLTAVMEAVTTRGHADDSYAAVVEHFAKPTE
ncbi:NAD(P)-dependent oxidoreductase [Kitasatospora sp. NPDC059146]|uniref:NAD(P)-dependent oxidoreductase n=1 Tax=Kitasatospora sp. NPDC059146 TaxID=3346741 RepID=UPI0036A7632D